MHWLSPPYILPPSLLHTLYQFLYLSHSLSLSSSVHSLSHTLYLLSLSLSLTHAPFSSVCVSLSQVPLPPSLTSFCLLFLFLEFSDYLNDYTML
jgi:hypothetical protein